MSGADLPPLIPAQQRALREIEALLVHEPVVALVGERGMGKSHVVRALSKARGGTILDLRDYMAMSLQTANEKWDNAAIALVERALEGADLFILDDFLHLVSRRQFVSEWWRSPRFEILRERAAAAGKRLLLCGRDRRFDLSDRGDHESAAITQRYIYKAQYTPVVELAREGLQVDDYRGVAIHVLGKEQGDAIDFEAVHDYAPLLSARQLATAARLSAGRGNISTAGFVAVLRDYIFRSNLRRHEVEHVPFGSLPGTEAIADAFETHLVMPFENPGLARELGIRPRRGVMLFGPPGTGKTSIGRALAHRLGSRFFLLDGSFVTEPPFVFVAQVRSLFKRLVDNAPSVLFIDDADVLFAVPHTAGLVRQLLSLLDGVESKNAGKVCVMITAMDPAAVPDALLRSGRVELWLEAKLPDAATRREILRIWAGEEEQSAEDDELIELTEDFTPADLRRVAGDARLLRARDRQLERGEQSSLIYRLRAARGIVAMRNQMAAALGETPGLEIAA